MFRAILYFIVTLVVISVLRAVMAMIGKAFGSLFGGDATSSEASTASSPSRGSGAAPGSGPRPSSGPEVLEKDPVCGTFVAPSTAFQLASGGKTHYFCSKHCREEFKG